MNPLTSLFARGFESIYHVFNTKKTCALRLDPDLFNGTQYSIDAFYDYVTPFFDRPCDFFVKFREIDELHLREGRHPKAELRSMEGPGVEQQANDRDRSRRAVFTAGEIPQEIPLRISCCR